MAGDPVWLRLLLQAVGPLITALGVGFVANIVLARMQARREERTVKNQLAVDMTETASALYYATQLYLRRVDTIADDPAQLKVERKALDDEYRTRRVAGDALEMRLLAYFPDGQAPREWHAALDLLTVRYLHAVAQGPVSDEALAKNAGDAHSGLSVEALRDPELVRVRYRERLTEATRLVLAGKRGR